MARTSRIVGLLVGSLLAVTTGAHAEDLERAKELFKSGLDDMLAGRFDTGCPAIAESYRLSALPGALFTLAECEAKWGKLASAQAHYREYLTRYVGLAPAERSRQAERKSIATDQIEALDETIPRLTIVVSQGAPAPEGIERNGEAVPERLWGSPIPLDPGEHRFVVRWPGGKTSEHSRELKPGGRSQLAVAPPAQGATPGGNVPPPDTPEPDGSDGDSLTTAGFVIGALGVAGLAVGGITGGLAMSAKSGVDDHCVETVCTQEGKDAADKTKTLGDTSTAAFVIGGAALVTGIVLLAVGASGDDAPSAPEGQAASSAASWIPLVGVTPGRAGGAFVGARARW